MIRRKKPDIAYYFILLKVKSVQDYSSFVSFVSQPYNGDIHVHGTHCAGITAARTNNNIGIAGYAPKTKIMPLHILDNSSDDTSMAKPCTGQS
ncbi:hypothetical protein COW36_06460 [bacterium (Candidatus Blackallbacteria) CG17_big_fil_post_rev_8_21_14_2_50_48_46]|uniref:Peptidase S8/S53 domain-containing protein n=1 Tax=bacterium (Candidatus Blackallbacteria) CG17_big_fil_post_rev_8_21_14_2_50_48_46 TaxID=2014261 RepID=A0A2M7G7I6_9BACT|nr:MAG: hypothetical protein COW36_06460 [bacterium (Candidatus Blackallbacteria) CG17_big_fil_post_rev_8_21_14_2_50_48_46]